MHAGIFTFVLSSGGSRSAAYDSHKIHVCQSIWDQLNQRGTKILADAVEETPQRLHEEDTA